MLYPYESQTRQVKELNGLWKFKPDAEDVGIENQWYQQSLAKPILMPVPASYNDITQDIQLRDHIGNVWYERTFFVPADWKEKDVILRFGSVTHHAIVWVNGREVVRNKGGFLPFEVDISDAIDFSGPNRLTVRVNNVLDWQCLPPGYFRDYSQSSLHPEGHRTQGFHFDFFNFSGIHRPVKLIALNQTRVDDITVITDFEGSNGRIDYAVKTLGDHDKISVTLNDEDGKTVAEGTSPDGTLCIPDVRLWCPDDPYLYDIEVRLFKGWGLLDCYTLPVGVRTVKVDGQRFLLNDKPFYFKGFGKHEDMDIKGKGADDAINVKDFNLLKWIGANSFRTSHYPYSEEIMQLADRMGIVVIDELPAVGLSIANVNVFTPDRVNDETLAHHKDCMTQLYNRDKNHPCVVMWSLANESATNEDNAVPYFEAIVKHARSLDSSRPLTNVENRAPSEAFAESGVGFSKVAHLFDVVCINKYNSWYSDSGRLDLIEMQLEAEMKKWFELYQKPVFVTEFGADTIAGFHQDPPAMFTEEYQCHMLANFQKVFDRLDFVIGEHVWNFADFATSQGVRRVNGNKKGVFARQRQPKMAAHMLRQRWLHKTSSFL